MKLNSIITPQMEFSNEEKGDALHGELSPIICFIHTHIYCIHNTCDLDALSAMELALSLEKLVNEKLLYLHSVRINVVPDFSLHRSYIND